MQAGWRHQASATAVIKGDTHRDRRKRDRDACRHTRRETDEETHRRRQKNGERHGGQKRQQS